VALIVREGIKIGKECTIGMGAVIKKDIEDFSIIK
tara:strand:+ start:406 stop:510 length:105 start_codon:yes stop_codon:yes gene_type:complete